MRRPLTIAGVVAVSMALATAGAGVSIALAGASPQGFRVSAQPATPVNVEPPTALNLTTLDAINQHLRSRGLDPSTFVVQQGPLNYAGPNCPGAVFNCTTATRVIQIATGGASALLALLGPTSQSTPPNKAECKASPPNEAANPQPPGAIGCVILQTAPAGDDEVDQQASCKVESKKLEKQVCDITQENDSGGDNQAQITMKIDSKVGMDQFADQEAVAYQQTVGGGNNQLQVDETIVLAAQGSPTTQDGYQSLIFYQSVYEDDGVQSGNNQAQMTQSQNFTAYTSTGGEQSQNTGTSEFGDPCFGAVDDSNSCVQYNQYTGSGKNHFQADQKHDLKATSASADVMQVQGCDLGQLFFKPCGLEEVGDQTTDEESKNEANVFQGGNWVLEAPEGADQNQDPHFGGAGTIQCCSDEDSFSLTQKAFLKASSTAVQTHENVVDDQSNGEVFTKSIITLNDVYSVVTCHAEDGGRCTYEQTCTNVEPSFSILENGNFVGCPPEDEGEVEPLPPETSTNGD